MEKSQCGWQMCSFHDNCRQLLCGFGLISVHAIDEHSILAEQLDPLRTNDLLVLDRGYPAYWLFALLLASQRHFCIRLP